MQYFQDKAIVITGAAQGIGRALSLEMAKFHGKMILLDIQEAKLQALVQEIQQQGGVAHGLFCDLSNQEQIVACCKRILNEFGPVDILINNAGIVSGRPFLQCSQDQVERTLRVNTFASIWMVKELLPQMQQRNQGHLVQLASAAGLVGVAQLADYCASKFAVVGFHESIHYELQKNKSNIATTLVCPYYIDTGMFAGVKTRFPLLLPILSEQEATQKILRAIAKRKPRLIMPWLVQALLPLRILPTSWFDWIVNFFGVNVSMETFKGTHSA